MQMLAKAWRQFRERPFAGVAVSLAIHLAILALLLCGLVPAVIGAINVGVYNAASSLFRWRNIVAFAVVVVGATGALRG